MKLKINKAALAVVISSFVLVGCSNSKAEGQQDINNKDTVEEIDKNNNDIKTEKDLIDYFVSDVKKIQENSDNEPWDKFKEKCYKTTTQFGAFILEGKEINGYTFENISDVSKDVIVELSVAADKKILEYFPEHKEYINSKTTIMKSGIKNFTVDMIGEGNYKKFGIQKDGILDEIKEEYEKGKEKVKNKYEEFKNKNQ